MVDNFLVEKFMVEKTGVEKSGLKCQGLKCLATFGMNVEILAWMICLGDLEPNALQQRCF